MLETLLSPLTDYFLGTVGDPSANVEAARSAASGNNVNFEYVHVF